MSWGKLPDNPFVGLRPFESHESLLFFGRHEQSVGLLEQLHATRFLAVVGSSGSGKSSLVRAGLIPKLQAGFLVDDRDLWRVATMKPGDAPLSNLAAALVDELALPEVEAGGFAEEVRERGVLAVLERAAEALSDGANLLLLVDQFEELFRFGLHTAGGERGEEAAHFVSILLELAAQRELPIYVVMTMRSDFLGDCDAFLGLPEAMNRGQYLVPRLTRQQRREAIAGPIKLYRAEIAPRLVDRLLNETIEARDDLPVLQHALMRTWEAWSGRREGPIDVEHYEEVGTIAHALEQHAEEAMKGLGEDDEELTRRIFQALTETDPGNRRIRRPARLGEIERITEESRETIIQIIDRFRSGGRTFLFVSGDETGPDATVDISHESLIRQWSRLEAWVDAEAESARTLHRIAEDTALYRGKRGELYRGAALQVAETWKEDQAPTAYWAARYGHDLVPILGFLSVSREAEKRSIREKEERRRRELRRTRWVAAVLGVAFLLTLALGLWALRQKRQADLARETADSAREAADLAAEQEAVAKEEAERALEQAEAAEEAARLEADQNAQLRNLADAERDEAERQRNRAETQTVLAEDRLALAVAAQAEADVQRRQALARYLASQADDVLGNSGASVMLSGLLATESLAAADTDQGHRAWRQAFARMPQALLSFSGDPATALALSPDGKILAAAQVAIQPGSVLLEDEGGLVLYERRTARELRRAAVDHPVRRLLFSPDGATLVAAGEGRATVFSAADLQMLRHTEAWAGVNRVPGLAFSADGRWLALGVAGYLQILDTRDWAAEARGVGLPDYGISVAAGPGEESLADAAASSSLIDFVTTGGRSLVAVDLEAADDNVVAEWPLSSLLRSDVGCDVPVHVDAAGRLYAAPDRRIFGCTVLWHRPASDARCRELHIEASRDCRDGFRSLATDAAGRRLMAVTGDGTGSLFRVVTKQVGLAGPAQADGLADEQLLGVSLDDRKGRRLQGLYASGDLSRDGRWLVAAGRDLTLWSTTDLGEAVEARRLGAPAHDTAWAPGGPLAVLQGAAVSVFDPATWNEIVVLDLGCDGERIEASEDGAWLAARCDGGFRVLETDRWQVVLAAELAGLESLRFSPDSSLLIGVRGDEGRTVEIFEAGSWRRTTLELDAADGPLRELAWGPRPGFLSTTTRRQTNYLDFPDSSFTGRWAATFDTIRVWDLSVPAIPAATRRVTRTSGAPGPIEDGVEEDGRTELLHETAMATSLPLEEATDLYPSLKPWQVTISGSELRVESESTGHLVDEACSRLPRDLDATESSTYFQKAEPRTTCADCAGGHLARGRDLARLGYPVPAATALRRALELDPSLDFDPKEELRLFAAQGALEEGRELAAAGDLEAARSRLAEALELNPALILDPEAEVQRLAPVP